VDVFDREPLRTGHTSRRGRTGAWSAWTSAADLSLGGHICLSRDTPPCGLYAQVMGPDDSYLVQYSDDVKSFWADSSSLALGGCFKRAGQAAPPRVAVTEVSHQETSAQLPGAHWRTACVSQACASCAEAVWRGCCGGLPGHTDFDPWWARHRRWLEVVLDVC
jgi:Tocopherol cyclase